MGRRVRQVLQRAVKRGVRLPAHRTAPRRSGTNPVRFLYDDCLTLAFENGGGGRYYFAEGRLEIDPDVLDTFDPLVFELVLEGVPWHA